MRLSLALAAALGFGTLSFLGLAPQQAPAQSADAAESSATASGEVSFNLFALQGFGQFRTFTFDAGYTERFGLPVPQPFQIAVPVNSALELISDGAPDSGFAKFTWVAGEGDDRQFVENIVIHHADWPQGDAAQRNAAVMALIRDNVFAQATAQHGGGELKAWGESELNGLTVQQVAGTYTDAQWGPMLLRITAFPNPGEGPSYFVLNNISLNMVPIVHLDQLRSTLGGKTLLSFAYLTGE